MTSKAFLGSRQQANFFVQARRKAYNESIPVISIINTINLSPTSVQEFIIFDLPI